MPPVAAQGEAGALIGESRWPPVAAVLGFMVMNIAVRLWLPREGAIRTPWLLPVIEGVLLVVLLTNDLSSPSERRRAAPARARPRRPSRRRGVVGDRIAGR